jgi:Fic/DOC family N-terminal/RNA repair pathway DNA polymerase beta family
LIRPFVQREAVLWSKIEGTQATLGELLAAEAGAIMDRSPEDLREVGNYVVALERGISRLEKLRLCVRLTRDHPYSFPPPDSDYDWGVHILPAERVLGLYPDRDKIEFSRDEGIELSLVTHEY